MQPLHPTHAYPSAARARFTVCLLMLALVLSFIDRQIISLLVGPIRQDLDISDTQISLLMGVAFALFYTLAGIPLGRLADTRSRRGLIGIGVLLWSLMTAFCGLAQNFWHLLLARIGVGVGEASLAPAAYSLIADSFVPEKRASAIGLFQMGVYLGSGMAFILGGSIISFANHAGHISLPLVGQVAPWQFIFIILGLFGIGFSLLLLALKEPARQGKGAGVQMPLLEVERYLKKIRRAIGLHNLGFACLAFASYGSQAWMPSFFMRHHDLSPAQMGIQYGVIVLIFGSLGVILGGRLADYMSRKGKTDAYLRLALYAALLGLPTNVMYLLNDLTAVWALFCVSVFLGAIPFGLAPAAIQEIVPNSMRGQTSAIYLFSVNIIGLGLGPTGVALLTDYVFGYDLALRYSLVWAITGMTLVAIVLLALGLKPYRQARHLLSQWTPH